MLAFSDSIYLFVYLLPAFSIKLVWVSGLFAMQLHAFNGRTFNERNKPWKNAGKKTKASTNAGKIDTNELQKCKRKDELHSKRKNI